LHQASSSPVSPPPHGPTRLAGALYLVVVVTGVFSLGVAPARLFVGETAAELAADLMRQETLLRLSIVSEAACYVAFAGLALALHHLFRAVDAAAATIMATLVLISVPFGFANLAHLVEIMRTLESGEAAEAAASIQTALDGYRAGIFLQSVPWGAWLLPFGYLVLRSRFLPAFLGVLLALAGIGYLAHFAARVLVDGYAQSVWPRILSAPRVGEMLICGWMLAFGARRARFWRP
jgi:hypothetical protein